MQNKLIMFEGHEVEVFELNGQVLFNPKHVAECLEIADINSSIRNFNDKQVRKVRNSDVHSLHIRKLNNAGENFLTESGVYKLVFKSHKPNAEKFTDWIADEVLPTLRKTGTYSIKKQLEEEKQAELEIKKMRAEAMQINAKTRAFKELKETLPKEKLSNVAMEVFGIKFLEDATGKNMGSQLPQVEMTYSASEVGARFGISANMIGRIAKKHDLKTKEYGIVVMDKSAYSSKEMPTFRYNDKAIEKFKEILKQQTA